MEKTPVRYPIGIQSFESLRSLGYIYVDKTELIHNLVTTSKCVFLSRPRRFGKSLLLSTIQAYFEGRRELFKGLAMERLETEWPVHPVLKLSLATYRADNGGNLEDILDVQFRYWERQYGITAGNSDPSSRFRDIIMAAHDSTGQTVVVLVDEYDHPLVETMHDEERREAHRLLLKSVYVNIKDLDRYIRFTMLTGVSRFSKMTIFSGLNNLKYISLNRNYAAICGITDSELLENFQQGIERLADEYDTDYDGAVALLKTNYDGYHFARRSPDIYNPFSLLYAFDDGEFGSYWFQSGTPESLVRQIRNGGNFLPEMFDETVEESIISNIDMSQSTPIALLYQTGYLTIKEFEQPNLFRLGIPNLEVRQGLFNSLARYYLNENPIAISRNVREVRKLLEERRIDEAMERLRTFMAGIPYEFAENAVELHYENNLFIIFVLVGVDARPEWHTSQGRIDLLLRMRNYIYVIELKRDGTPEEALEQIREKDYTRQFLGDPRPVVELGVTFSTKTRNITAWKVRE